MGGKKKKEEKVKPFEKMTTKELRAIALEMPEIHGVHGMNKEELIFQIKTAKGIQVEQTSNNNTSMRDIKKKIKELKTRRETAVSDENMKMAGFLKRRIAKLKKKTRKAA